MKQIRVLIFLTCCLSLVKRHFGSKTYVNTICFKSNVCIGYKHDPKHLLRPKMSWFLSRKFFWFGIIWVLFAKIDFLGLFGTQILSLNLRVQSKKRHNEKCRIFEKFRKVPINQLVFNYSACKLVHIILTSLFSLDMMFILYWSPYKSFKKSLKLQSN